MGLRNNVTYHEGSGFPGHAVEKNRPANAVSTGDTGSIPGSGSNVECVHVFYMYKTSLSRRVVRECFSFLSFSVS